MGAWDQTPWGNDAAADWFDSFMKKTDVRKHVMDAVLQKFEGGPYADFEAGGTDEQLAEIRAAISVFIMLGRIYVWPADSYGEDLQAVVDRAQEIRSISQEDEEPDPAMDKEVAIPERRLERLKNRIPQETDWPWGMDS